MPSRPAASRRSSAQARTKLALLDAGRSLLSRDGYRATSIDAIARLAGVTKGAFYANFDSKAALYQELLAGHFAESEARFREFASVVDPDAMLTSLEGYLLQSAAEVDWGALVIELRTGMPENAQANDAPANAITAAERLHEAERHAISAAITQLFVASHKRLPVAADDLADAFIAMSKGFALRRRAGHAPPAADVQREVQLLLLLVRSVLSAAPDA